MEGGRGRREAAGLPKEFLDMMKIVDRLGYYDDPPYGELYGLMSNAIFLFGNVCLS